MSSYPISGYGLPSKSRRAQPSMFQILSWAGENQMSESRYQQPQTRVTQPVYCNCAIVDRNTKTQNYSNEYATNCCHCCHPMTVYVPQVQNVRTVNEQVYKEHKSPQKIINTQNTLLNKATAAVQEDQVKEFKKSKVHQKQIKHELYSYEPVSLKASRSKSTVPIQKIEAKPQKQSKKEEVILDEKTVEERKQRIKQFQLFTRVLPNSAFTTYYGKPAFENYGRGTSSKNLKSFNVMPHKGDNHPKELQSHYTALLKARNVKSKSHMPRKPVQQVIPPANCQQQQNQQIEEFDLPLQKPDLIKSNRFATIVPEKLGKKEGPPIVSKSTIQKSRKNQTQPKPTQKRQTKQKNNKKPLGDGLKFMNKRQNLIDLLEQKKLKSSQLAYKVTECYPLQFDASRLQQSTVTKQNWDELKPAGKLTQKGDPVSDLIQSQFILQQANRRAQ